jgi:heat shock protein beta
LWESWQEEVPDESATAETPAAEDTPAAEETPAADAEKTPEADEDEAIVEDITKDDEKVELPPPKMVNVTKEQWSHLNAQPPLWSRDPKNITDGDLFRVLAGRDGLADV